MSSKREVSKQAKAAQRRKDGIYYAIAGYALCATPKCGRRVLPAFRPWAFCEACHVIVCELCAFEPHINCPMGSVRYVRSFDNGSEVRYFDTFGSSLDFEESDQTTPTFPKGYHKTLKEFSATSKNREMEKMNELLSIANGDGPDAKRARMRLERMGGRYMFTDREGRDLGLDALAQEQYDLAVSEAKRVDRNEYGENRDQYFNDDAAQDGDAYNSSSINEQGEPETPARRGLKSYALIKQHDIYNQEEEKKRRERAYEEGLARHGGDVDSYDMELDNEAEKARYGEEGSSEDHDDDVEEDEDYEAYGSEESDGTEREGEKEDDDWKESEPEDSGEDYADDLDKENMALWTKVHAIGKEEEEEEEEEEESGSIIDRAALEKAVKHLYFIRFKKLGEDPYSAASKLETINKIRKVMSREDGGRAFMHRYMEGRREDRYPDIDRPTEPRSPKGKEKEREAGDEIVDMNILRDVIRREWKKRVFKNNGKITDQRWKTELADKIAKYTKSNAIALRYKNTVILKQGEAAWALNPQSNLPSISAGQDGSFSRPLGASRARKSQTEDNSITGKNKRKREQLTQVSIKKPRAVPPMIRPKDIDIDILADVRIKEISEGEKKKADKKARRERETREMDREEAEREREIRRDRAASGARERRGDSMALLNAIEQEISDDDDDASIVMLE